MSTILSDEVEQLISRLARPLSPPDRVAFRAAAEDALAHVPVRGPGSNFRALRDLQRAYFSPPPDRVASWRIEREFGPSKLRDAPPIEHGDLRRVPRKQQAR